MTNNYLSTLHMFTAYNQRPIQYVQKYLDGFYIWRVIGIRDKGFWKCHLNKESLVGLCSLLEGFNMQVGPFFCYSLSCPQAYTLYSEIKLTTDVKTDWIRIWINHLQQISLYVLHDSFLSFVEQCNSGGSKTNLLKNNC